MDTLTPNDITAWNILQKNIASCGHEIRFVSTCKPFLEDTCNVCFEDYIDHLNRSIYIVHPCGHAAHGECIENWLKRNNTCTQCRGIGNRVIQFKNLKTLISSLNTCNKDRCYNNKSLEDFNIVEILAITPKQSEANLAEEELANLAEQERISIPELEVALVVSLTTVIKLIAIKLFKLEMPLEPVIFPTIGILLLGILKSPY